MSQSDSQPDTPTAAGILLGFGQPQQSLFLSVEGLVQFNAALHDLEKEIADGKVDNERNAEQQDFMALPPAGDVGDDSVFSVGAESQFSDSTPRDADAPVLNLRQQLKILCTRRDSLKRQILAEGDKFFQWLSGHFHGMKIYGNHPLVAGPEGQSMLVPMLSFYGIATKDMIPNIKVKISIESITKNIKARVKELFTTPIGIPDVDVDCPEPSGTNLVWNVRLTLNGNIFTLLTFRVVAMTNMTNTDFPPQAYPLSPQNLFMLLCFALLSKACAKDFNCLCGMPDIDVQLFKSLLASDPQHLQAFAPFVQKFLDALAEPQNDSKKKYMVAALHNLVASCNDATKTGETLAYKMLFDGHYERGVSGSGAHTFNPIMREITKVIRIFRGLQKSDTSTMKELQVSLCGGRMIYKLGDIVKSHVTQVIGVKNEAAAIAANRAFGFPILEMLKPLNLPSDLDYTLTFGGYTPEGDNEAAYEFLKQTQQTYLMFFTLCLQLGIKKIIDTFCTTGAAVNYFLGQPAVVGMSLVGGDFQLSSSRNSCAVLPFLDAINISDPRANAILGWFLQQCQPLREGNDAKSSLAPCDLVPKIQSGNYIVKIAHYIFESGYITISIPANIAAKATNIAANIAIIADRISKYSMSTDEGFSSPVKVLFDIFFTLFSIENFTNRAFVTQKINKELKRIAICASILFFHFHELLPMYTEGSTQTPEITSMIGILIEVIKYGYNPAIKLLSDEIDSIMATYASCFVQLLHLYSPGMDVVFYSRTPGDTLPKIGERGESSLTRLERACMHMIVEPDPSQDVFQAEGLPIDDLTSIITYGLQFLGSIEGTDILPNFLKLKQEVKDKDLQYKARGEFLTSIEAFDLFLRDFVHMLLVPNSPLVALLNPLLQVFRKPELGLAELMHFQPIVVIKSENLRVPVAAVDLQGLKVTGEYQFGIYVILSIFGVKFKSEWSKISLFTRMLFYQLLSRADAMHGVCSILLGVDLTKVDPSKMRVSSENFMKDQILFEAIQQCGIMPELLPSLQTYYGNDKLRHGIDTYKNSLLDTGQVRHSFIQPINYDTDEDILSFQFLNSVNLQRLMACPRGAFQRLLPDGFQPRAYEFLLQRLTDKFSILTKECDDNATKELLALRHSGRPKKELKREFKVQGFDAFIDSVVSDLLVARPVTLEQFNELMYNLISSLDNNAYAACFKGEEVDISKFRELAPDQCKYWIYHLLEMIMFYYNLSIVRGDLVYLCVENIKKYFKLLFLLKNYLPMDQEVVQAVVNQAAVQQAAINEASRQAALSLRPRRDRPASSSEGRGRNRSKSPQGGGSPKASVSKTNPKTRNNRYSKNARTRKNKHKRKQHRNRKYKKTTNTKSNRRTKPQSKKNVTFKRRRR